MTARLHRMKWIMFLAICQYAIAQSSCVFEADGSFPQPGSCSGPMARAVLQYSRNNTGCSKSQVSYAIDGGSNFACGQCRPGETGLGFSDIAAELSLVLSMANYDPSTEAAPFFAGALFSCAMNEYCTDKAKCESLQLSPLYGLPCPTETGTAGWCGPGLHCIEHVCKICAEGSFDALKTRMCMNGVWMSEPWRLALNDPTFLIICAAVCLLVLQIAISITVMYCAARKRGNEETNQQIQSKPDNQMSTFPDAYANVMESESDDTDSEPQ